MGYTSFSIVNADRFDAWRVNENLPDLPGSVGTKAYFQSYAPPVGSQGDPAFDRLSGRQVLSITLSAKQKTAGLPALLREVYKGVSEDVLANSHDLDAARLMFKTGKVLLPIHPRSEISKALPSVKATTGATPAAPTKALAPSPVRTHEASFPSAAKLKADVQHEVSAARVRADKAVKARAEELTWVYRAADEESLQRIIERETAELRESIVGSAQLSAETVCAQKERMRPVFTVYQAARRAALTQWTCAMGARDFAVAARLARMIEAMDRAAAKVGPEAYSVEEPKWTTATNELRGEVYLVLRATGLSKDDARKAVFAEPVSNITNDPLAGIDDATIPFFD